MMFLRDIKQGQEFTLHGRRYMKCVPKELLGGPWAKYATANLMGKVLCFWLGLHGRKSLCLLRNFDRVKEGTANGGKPGPNPGGA